MRMNEAGRIDEYEKQFIEMAPPKILLEWSYHGVSYLCCVFVIVSIQVLRSDGSVLLCKTTDCYRRKPRELFASFQLTKDKKYSDEGQVTKGKAYE